MNILTPKEIYQLSQDLELSYENTESVINEFYNIILNHNYSKTTMNNFLNTVKDYFYFYYDLNCFVFNSLEDIINGIFQQKCAELSYNISQENIYKESINYVLKNINKTIFKMDNGSYLQCCI